MRTHYLAFLLVPVLCMTSMAGDASSGAETHPQQAEANVQPLDSVKMDFDCLRLSTPQVYKVQSNATGDSGTVSFTSSLVLETEVNGEFVIMRDNWTIGHREYDMSFRCRKAPMLPLIDGTLELNHNGKSQVASISFEGTWLRMQSEEKAIDLPYPHKTLLRSAALRLTPHLPRTPGQSYTFPALMETMEVHVRTPMADRTFQITCQGPTTIQLDRGPVDCTHYTLDAQRQVELFVDEASQLVRIEADQGQTVLDLQEQIMSVTGE